MELNPQKPKCLGGFGEINFGKQYRQGNRVYDSREIAMAITASPLGNTGGYSYLYVVEAKTGGQASEENHRGGGIHQRE